MTQFVRDEHEKLVGKKILNIGYDPTSNGYTWIILIKGKECYFSSETPIELEIRDVQ